MPTPVSEVAAGNAAFQQKQKNAIATFGDTTQPTPAVATPPAPDTTAAPAATSTDSLASRLQIITRILTGGGTDTYAVPGLTPTPTATSAIPQPTGSTGTTTTLHTYAPATGDKAAYQAYAQSKLADYGWDAKEMPYLIDLWNRESGWNPTAKNPHSTAYGIAQFLDSTWGNYGTKTANPNSQIDAGLKYIAARYGAPSAAIAFWNKNHYY